jgi:hypothetical protein
MPLEEKIVMEDHMKKLSHQFDCMLEIISSGKKEDQKKLFLACRNSLERNIDAVNNRIAVSAPLQFAYPTRQTITTTEGLSNIFCNYSITMN